ncbi:hypothetical protein DB34_07235 [Acetobacter pasteurianus]|nr:hypothetical protein DB34_07235 [Acetobacter pasteurianus]
MDQAGTIPCCAQPRQNPEENWHGARCREVCENNAQKVPNPLHNKDAFIKNGGMLCPLGAMPP